MIWQPHEQQSTVREFLEVCVQAWQDGERQPYVITQRDADAPIGMIDARIRLPIVDIGYVLGRTFWGQGLMPEAIEAVTRAALAHQKIFRVQATCDVENRASRRALEKSGFQLEGTLERYMIHPNISADPRDCLIFALCR